MKYTVEDFFLLLFYDSFVIHFDNKGEKTSRNVIKLQEYCKEIQEMLKRMFVQESVKVEEIYILLETNEGFPALYIYIFFFIFFPEFRFHEMLKFKILYFRYFDGH